MVIFKIRIKPYRTSKNLTQEELANLAGISQSYLNEIENNLRIPRLPLLEKISFGLGICLNKLIVPDNQQCKKCKRKFYRVRSGERNVRRLYKDRS